MAGEIAFASSQFTGDTLYFRLFDASGDVWSTVAAGFVTLAELDVGNYDIALVETGSTGYFKGDMPGASAGVFSFEVVKQAGGSPAWADDRIGEGQIHWDGSAEIPLNTILVDTNELQGDLTDGGRLDAIFDELTSQGDTNEGKLDTVDTVVDAVKAKTDNLPTDPADDSDIDAQLATIDTVVDAIKLKTDNLPASPAAVGSEMALEDDAITSAKYDESTAYPVKKADSGTTEIARTGADGDTLEDLSDEIAALDVLSATSVSGSVTAGTVVQYTDAYWSVTIDDLSGLLGNDAVYFALKENESDRDSKSLLFVSVGSGLEIQNGKSAADSSGASLTIDDDTQFTLVVEDTIVETIKPGSYHYAVKRIASGKAYPVTDGSWTVEAFGIEKIA